MLCALMRSVCSTNPNQSRSPLPFSISSTLPLLSSSSSSLSTTTAKLSRPHSSSCRRLLSSSQTLSSTCTSTSLKINNMTRDNASASSSMVSVISTASPPGSPPSSPSSPTMSMGSIDGHQPGLRKTKVMIIDDNSINLTILSRMLTKHFADTVDLAAIMTSGHAALEQLGREEFDLILMDIDMPGLTGVETTTAIRQGSEYFVLAQNQKAPIIAVTTSDTEEQKELYRQVGMSDCVSKPIDLGKLRLAIEQATQCRAAG